MTRKWFTLENTSLSKVDIDTLNRAVRIYLFGTAKESPTRDDLTRVREAYDPTRTAQEIADIVHDGEQRPWRL